MESIRVFCRPARDADLRSHVSRLVVRSSWNTRQIGGNKAIRKMNMATTGWK